MGSRPTTPASAPRTPLEIEYDRPQPSLIARRGYRVLVGLTLLNTLLFIGYFVAPTGWAFARQKWLARQAAVAQQQQAAAGAAAAAQRVAAANLAAQQNLAAERAKAEAKSAEDLRRRTVLLQRIADCRTHAFPPGRVVYERDRAAAAALLADRAPRRAGAMGAAAGVGGPEYVVLNRVHASIHPPVRITAAAPWTALVPLLDAKADGTPAPTDDAGNKGFADRGPPIFLHERKAGPASRPRLVAVLMAADHHFAFGPSGGGGAGSGVVLVALSIDTDAVPGQKPEVRETHILLTPSGNDVLDFTAPGGQPGVRSSRPLRLYAGQPDPTDAARFTIDAVFEDRRATLHGQLLPDETIEFTPGPGTGVTTTDDGRQYWDLDPGRHGKTR